MMKFGRIVPRVNVHRLTESTFGCDVILSRWRPWCHFTKTPNAPSIQIGLGWNLAGMFFM